ERRIDRGVAGGEPRKAREDPAAQPFDERPSRVYRERRSQRARRGNSRLQRSDERGKESKERAEGERSERCDRCRHAAEAMDADEDPRNAGAEKAEAEPESGKRRRPDRRCALPGMDQQRMREQRCGENVERRKTEHGDGAGGEQKQRLRPFFRSENGPP